MESAGPEGGRCFQHRISACKGWLNKTRETRMGFLMDWSAEPPRWVFWLVRPHKVSNKVSLAFGTRRRRTLRRKKSELCPVDGTWAVGDAGSTTVTRRDVPPYETPATARRAPSPTAARPTTRTPTTCPTTRSRFCSDFICSTAVGGVAQW